MELRRAIERGKITKRGKARDAVEWKKNHKPNEEIIGNVCSATTISVNFKCF